MSLAHFTNAARALLEVKDEPFIANLRVRALKNTDFRRVVYTGKKVQFTVMSIPPDGEVGAETHKNVEQVFFCVAGEGEADYGGTKSKFGEGDVLVVPPGTNHNIVNTGTEPLKFYTSYSPPNHLPDTVHKTKADADADDADEKFGQKVAKEHAMDAKINLKLEAMRRLIEAQHPASYAARLMDADEAFLSQVMKNTKSALGKKLASARVHRGHGVVFLEGSGEDKSDLSVEFVVSLNLTSAFDATVTVSIDHAQRGKFDVTRSFKVGELTPDVPTKMVLEMFE